MAVEIPQLQALPSEKLIDELRTGCFSISKTSGLAGRHWGAVTVSGRFLHIVTRSGRRRTTRTQASVNGKFSLDGFANSVLLSADSRGVEALVLLDDSLWIPSALGTIGPTGFVTFYLRPRSDECLYTSFDEASLSPPSLSERASSIVSVVRGRAELADISPLGLEYPRVLSPSAARADDQWVGSVARISGREAAIGFNIAQPFLQDPRIAQIRFFWMDPEYRKLSFADVQLGMLLLLVHELAVTGFVGAIALVQDPNVRAMLRATIAGVPKFQTIHEVLSDRAVFSYLGWNDS